MKNRGALTLAVLLFTPSSALAPETSAPCERTLLFVGDVMLSRGVGRKMKSLGDWTFPFQKVAEKLRSADLTFGNLECPLSGVGHDLHHRYSFRADPRAVGGLTFAGFRAMSVANNHIDDWDRPALLDTLRRLREADIHPVGAGANDLEAHYPVLLSLGGVKLAFLAYVDVSPRDATAGIDRPGVAWLEPERVLADIRFARPLAEVLIVSLHWGVEYTKRPDHAQVRLAHRMIDAGADLVVGGHPHVVQPLEEYRGRWIAYSLGNFVFDQKSPATHRGLMLEVKLQGNRIASVRPFPVSLDRQLQVSIPTGIELAHENRKVPTAVASRAQ
jgi:poly-gamma-glutamate synthesis protein (capsule biosynthesis protein)